MNPADDPDPASNDPEGRQVEAASPGVLAIGVGFRTSCTIETLAALVRDAMGRVRDSHPGMVTSPPFLATIAEKDRPALHGAAVALGLRVIILSKQALAGTHDRTTIASPAAQACFGIPSVAEAAALAAAGPGSRLLLARVSVPQATCAIAVSAPPVGG